MKTNYKTNIIALAILLMGSIANAQITSHFPKFENGRGKKMLIRTRDGAFGDWHHLRLVANYDNSQHRANIIFGFDGDNFHKIREEMTLTSAGSLIVGRHKHNNSNTYNAKAFDLGTTYDNGRKSYTNDRLQVYGNLRIASSDKLGTGIIKNWGVMEFLADDDQSNDRIYKFQGYEDREKNKGTSEYITFDAKKNKNLINGETTFINDIRLKEGLIKDWGVMKFLADDDESGDRVYKFKGYEKLSSNKGAKDYIVFDTKQRKNIINGYTSFLGNIEVAKNFTVGKSFNFNGNINFTNLKKAQQMNVTNGLQINLKNSNKKNIFKIGSVAGANAFYVANNGKVGIGTEIPSERLQVEGKVKASSFVADASAFPDYVFANTYELKPLHQVKEFVTTKKHLPGMPTEKEVITNGLDLKKVTTISVEKIEELYLYTIKQQELIEKLTKRIELLEKNQKN